MREGEGGRGRIRNAKCNFLPRSTEQGMDAAANGRGRADGRAICRSNFAKHPVPPLPPLPCISLLPSPLEHV